MAKLISQLSDDLQRKVLRIFEEKNPVEIAARDTVALMFDRIFIKGGATQGKIGKYAKSTEKIRRKKGYRTDYVNLVFTGRLASNFANSSAQVTELGQNKVPSDFSVIKITNYEFGIKLNEENQKKADYMTEHFGKPIFKFRKSEIDNFNKVLRFEFNKALSNA